MYVYRWEACQLISFPRSRALPTSPPGPAAGGQAGAAPREGPRGSRNRLGAPGMSGGVESAHSGGRVPGRESGLPAQSVGIEWAGRRSRAKEPGEGAGRSSRAKEPGEGPPAKVLRPRRRSWAELASPELGSEVGLLKKGGSWRPGHLARAPGQGTSGSHCLGENFPGEGAGKKPGFEISPGEVRR